MSFELRSDTSRCSRSIRLLRKIWCVKIKDSRAARNDDIIDLPVDVLKLRSGVCGNGVAAFGTAGKLGELQLQTIVHAAQRVSRIRKLCVAILRTLSEYSKNAKDAGRLACSSDTSSLRRVFSLANMSASARIKPISSACA